MRKRTLILFLLLPLLTFAQKPELVVPLGHSGQSVRHTYSPDGRYILTYAFSDPTVRLWNLSGKELQSFQTGDRYIQSVCFSADGRRVIESGWREKEVEDSLGLYTYATLPYITVWQLDGTMLADIEGDPDGTLSDVKEVFLEEEGVTLPLPEPQEEPSLPDNFPVSGYTRSMDFAFFGADGTTLISNGAWNLQNNRIQATDESRPFYGGFTGDVLWSPGREYIFGTSADEPTPSLYPQTEAAATAIKDNLPDSFSGHTGPISSAAFSSDGQYILTGSFDQTARLEQLKARYYEPGLLQKVLGYSNERVRPVEAFEEVRLYPKIAAEIENDSLHITLRARNGGIGKVSIFINGKEVIEEANPLPRGVNPKRDSIIRLDLSEHQRFLLHHPDSTNTISIRAYNEAGWLKSRAYPLSYRPDFIRTRGNGRYDAGSGWEGQLDPKLYVITVGTSDYTGEQLDLQYADQDAIMMAQALQSVGTALFTASGDSLEVHCLSTTDMESQDAEEAPVQWQFANKKNIRATFESIRQRAKAEDVLIVYLSGHGVTRPGMDQTQFYYLTQGVSSEEDLSDPATLQAYTISSEELTRWINDIPALKQVLIIDACNSGQIVENLTGGTKSLNSSQIRALDRMQDRTGMFVLSGSASDKVSYEASEYGQGLLTYALLQGMLGVATRKDAQGQDVIDVMKLFQYARDEVPRLASSIRGIQTPMLGFPYQAASFDIGILDEEAKRNIPIGNKKPVFVRSLFFNKRTFRDDLKLAEQLESALRKETERGSSADLIYVDVQDYPGAYSVSGLYERTEEGVQIAVKLFRDKKDPITLDIRPADDPERLVSDILRAIKQALGAH